MSDIQTSTEIGYPKIMHPPSIQKLIEEFSKFPTVGPRTAARFVFYLLKLSKEEINNLLESISSLCQKVKACPFCFSYFEGDNELCPICSDHRRDKTLLCVVEKEADLISIEKTGKYSGRYFILGGAVSKLRKEDLNKLRTEKLLEIAKNREAKELILAFNSTTEGEATALYLERLLKPFGAAQGKKITRLGRGLPVGGELEYSDQETLSSAMEGRK